MTIAEKRKELNRDISHLELLIPNSSGDNLIARKDHLERLKESLRLYSGYHDSDLIICELLPIILTEGEDSEFNFLLECQENLSK